MLRCPFDQVVLGFSPGSGLRYLYPPHHHTPDTCYRALVRPARTAPVQRLLAEARRQWKLSYRGLDPSQFDAMARNRDSCNDYDCHRATDQTNFVPRASPPRSPGETLGTRLEQNKIWWPNSMAEGSNRPVGKLPLPIHRSSGLDALCLELSPGPSLPNSCPLRESPVSARRTVSELEDLETSQLEIFAKDNFRSWFRRFVTTCPNSFSSKRPCQLARENYPLPLSTEAMPGRPFRAHSSIRLHKRIPQVLKSTPTSGTLF